MHIYFQVTDNAWNKPLLYKVHEIPEIFSFCTNMKQGILKPPNDLKFFKSIEGLV